MRSKRAQDAEKRGMVMLGVEVPRAIIEGLDVLKKRRGVSRSRLVVTALTQFLKRSTIATTERM